jgi:hypothetical protein
VTRSPSFFAKTSVVAATWFQRNGISYSTQAVADRSNVWRIIPVDLVKATGQLTGKRKRLCGDWQRRTRNGGRGFDNLRALLDPNAAAGSAGFKRPVRTRAVGPHAESGTGGIAG